MPRKSERYFGYTSQQHKNSPLLFYANLSAKEFLQLASSEFIKNNSSAAVAAAGEGI